MTDSEVLLEVFLNSGHQLREYRIRNNIKFKEMADILKVSEDYLLDLENNKKLPSLHLAFQISQVIEDSSTG